MPRPTLPRHSDRMLSTAPRPTLASAAATHPAPSASAAPPAPPARPARSARPGARHAVFSALLLAAALAAIPAAAPACPGQGQAQPGPDPSSNWQRLVHATTPQAGQEAASPGAAPGDRRTPLIPNRDRTFLNDTVVRIEASAVPGAESTEALGARRSGTGVLLDRSTVLTIGYLLTEVDTVDVITPSGKRIPSKVAGHDPDSGFGLVRTAVPLDGRPLELGDSDAITERQHVLTLGHGEPEATELMVISRKPFAGNWEYLIDKGIFTFPPVNNWSGAALVDAQGKLIGIGSLIVNDAASSRPGVPGNLYVPVNLLKPILADLLATGRRSGPALPWLGVVTEEVSGGHLLVSRVIRDGPAERAGISAGDIIVSVDGDYVASQSAFYQGVRKRGSAGITVPLRVLKGGDLVDLRVKSSDRLENMKKPSGI